MSVRGSHRAWTCAAQSPARHLASISDACPPPPSCLDLYFACMRLSPIASRAVLLAHCAGWYRLRLRYGTSVSRADAETVMRRVGSCAGESFAMTSLHHSEHVGRIETGQGSGGSGAFRRLTLRMHDSRPHSRLASFPARESKASAQHCSQTSETSLSCRMLALGSAALCAC